jgi:hypothetical protein
MAITTLTDDRLGDAPSRGSDDADRTKPPGARVAAWIRANRLFTAALAAAAVLRLIVMLAYPPALEFYGDSPSYLSASRHPFSLDIWHPFGYPLMLWLLSPLRNVAVVTVLQHLAGLVAAWLVYRLVRSLGVGGLGGTLAAAPLLFDAYQVDVEQFLLSDTVFTLLVVVAMTLTARLLRRRGQDDTSSGTAVALGAVLSAMILTRTAGLAVAAAVLLVLLVTRIGMKRFALAVAAVALPVGTYALAFHASYGVYGLQGYGGRYLYGQVAPFAHCNRAALSVDMRPLCPTLPTYARPGVNQYVWHQYNQAHLPGKPIQRSAMAGKFARPIAVRQAGDVAVAAVGNFVHFFEPGRATGARDWPVGSWQFPLKATAPFWHIEPVKDGFRAGDRPHGSINVSLAHMLRSYQRVVFTPGPALLLAVLLAGGACLLRRTDPVLRAMCGLMALGGLGLLAMPSISAGFDWRYLLPAQALLVPAGVVGASAVAARFLPALRPAWRRGIPVVAGVVAVVVVAPGLASASVYDGNNLRSNVKATVPAALPIGKIATVDVGSPKLIGARCEKADDGKARLFGLIAFPMSVTYRSGAAQLVQPGNFDLKPGYINYPGIALQGTLFPDVVLSGRYPSAHGTLYAEADATRSTLRYVDPMGGGAAAWAVNVPEPDNEPPLGSPCTGTAPWAGMQLSYLRLRGVSPFTELDTQQVGYELAWEPWRADSFDLRFRVSSPTLAPLHWQFPKTWQHTTREEQSLLQLTPGATYCFEVRARDELDAATRWSLPKCTTRMYDDTSLPVGPDWTRTSGKSGFYSGTYTVTSTQGATVSVGGTYSRVAIAAYHCPTCGSLDIYAGTTLLKSLNLATTNGVQELRQWTSPVLPSEQTSLTLRVTSTNRLVAIDAFGMVR